MVYETIDLTDNQITEIEALNASLQEDLQNGNISQAEIDLQLDEKREEFMQLNLNNTSINPPEETNETIPIVNTNNKPPVKKENENIKTKTNDENSTETDSDDEVYQVAFNPSIEASGYAEEEQEKYNIAMSILDKDEDHEVSEDENFIYNTGQYVPKDFLGEEKREYIDIQHSSLVDKKGNPIILRKEKILDYNNNKYGEWGYYMVNENGEKIDDASKEQIKIHSTLSWMRDFRTRRQEILDGLVDDDNIKMIQDHENTAYHVYLWEKRIEAANIRNEKKFDFARDYQELMDTDGDMLVSKEEIEAKMDKNNDGEITDKEREHFQYWFDNEYSINKLMSNSRYADNENAKEFEAAYQEFHARESLKFQEIFENKFEATINDEVIAANEAYAEKFNSESTEIVNGVQEEVRDKIQEYYDTGVIDESWTQDMVNALANEMYKKRVEPHFKAWNEDNNDAFLSGLEKRLNPLQEGLADEINSMYKNSAQKFVDEYVDPLTPNLIDEEEFNKIDKFLDENGFGFQDFETKKAILGKAWDMIQHTWYSDLGLSSTTELLGAKDEFMKRYYKKLYTDEQGNFSQFALKDRAYELFRDADTHIGLNEAKIKAFQDKNPLFMTWYHAEEQSKEGMIRHPRDTWKQNNPDVDVNSEEWKDKTAEYERLIKEKIMLFKTDKFAKSSIETMDPDDLENNSGFTNFLNGLFSGDFVDIIPFISGINQMGDAITMLNLSKKDESELTNSEKAFLTSYTVHSQIESKLSKISQGYRTGKMTKDMIPYLFEMAMTSGIYAGARAGAKKLLTHKLKKYTTTQLQRYAKRGWVSSLTAAGQKMPVGVTVSKGAINGLSFLAGSSAQALANPQQWVTKTFENMTPEMNLAMTTEGDELLQLIGSFETGELYDKDGNLIEGSGGKKGMDAWEAVWKAYGVTWAEFATERFGAALPWFGKHVGKKGGALYKQMQENGPRWLQGVMLGRWMKKKGFKTVTEAADFIKKSGGKFANSKLASKIGYNGFVGEMFEELVNLPLQNMIEGRDLFDTGDQDFQTFCEDLGISIGAMTATGGMGGAMLNIGQKTPTYEVNVSNTKKDIQETKKFKTKEEQMEYIQSLDLNDKNTNLQVNIVGDNNAAMDMNDYLFDFKRTKDLVDKDYEKQKNDERVALDLEIKRRISKQDPSKVKEIEKNEDKISGLQAEIDNVTDGRKTWRKKAEIQKLQNLNKAIIKDSGVFEDLKKEQYYKKVKTIRDLAPQLKKELGMDIEVLETDTDGIREFTWQNELESRGIVTDERFTGDILKDEYVGAKATYKDSGQRVNSEVINEIKQLVNEAMDKRVHGFITDPVNNKRTIVINKQNALRGDAVNVAGHEFLHALLFNTLNNNPATAMALGKTLENYLENLDFLRIKDSEFRQRLFDYQTDPKRSSQSFEETFALFSDALATGDIKYNDGIGTRIGDSFRRVLRAAGAPVVFKNGRDAFNFVKDYNHAVEHGKLSRFMKKAAAGITLEGKMAQQRDVYQKMWDALPDEQQQKYKFSRDPKQFENTIQEMYNDPTMDKATKAFLIARTYDPRVKYNSEGFEDPGGTRTAGGVRINKELSKYSNLPDFSMYKNDITDEILDGVPERREGESTEEWMERGRSIRAMVWRYDPKTGVPLTGYIGSILSKRGISEQVGKFIQEDAGFKVDLAETKELEAEQPYVAPRDRKTIKLSERLGPKAKVINKKVRQEMKGVDLSGVNIKNLKDLTPELTADLFGIPVKKLLSGANLTKGELAKAQMFINKHADILWRMLPEGTTTSGTSTGVQNTLLQAFYDKTDRAKMVKTGAKSGLAIQIKKTDITQKDFLEIFGVIDGKPTRTDRNISARVLALATQTGKMLTNQGIREQMIADGKPLEAMRTLVDGKSPYMFSRGVMQPLGAIDRSIRDKNIKTEFWSRMGDVADAYIIESDPKSFEIALREIYSDIPVIMKVIPELSKALHNALEALSPKIKVKTPHIKSAKLVDALIKRNLKAEQTVKNFFRADKPVKTMFRDPLLRKQYIAIDKMYAEDIWDSKNIEQSIRMIKQMQDHSTTSPTRSQAYYDYDKNGKPRHAAFWTEQIWGTIKAIDPKLDYKLNAKGGVNYNSITYNGKPILKKDEDGNEIKIDFSFSANTSEKALEDAKKDLDKRRKDESDAQLFLNSYIEFWSNKYKEGKITNNHLAMVSGALLSNMNTSLARAATLKYLSINAYDFKNPGQDLKYEHLQPRVAVLIKMFDAHLNGDGITDISKFLENYNIQVIPNTMNDVLDDSGLQSRLYEGQTVDFPSWIRTFNPWTRENSNGRMVALRDVDTGEILEPSQAFVDALEILNGTIEQQQSAYKLSRAAMSSRVPRPVKGITVLDFDDTLATTESLVKYTTPEGEIGTLNAEQYANTYEDLLDKGYTFDFSDFNKVVKGKLAPLFNKAIKLQKKFGPENMFVLTARPPAAQKAIFDFLKANGLNIPLKNITGLGNSTAEAKALWMAEKVAEGYNDFYFADDALQNVQAVQNMLDQFDVKSKVQQAKLKFSKGISGKFNDILEQRSGVESQKVFSEAKGKIRGKTKGRFKWFIPPSAEDFKGLLYAFLPKGVEGDAALEFFKKALLDPYAKGYRELNSAKQQMSNDYNALRRANPDIRKKLSKKIEGQKDYRYGDAVRVYLWNKAGFKVPGLSKTDLAKLIDVVEGDMALKGFADNIGLISKRSEGYVKPSKEWLVGNILSDLDGANKVNRKEFLAEWIENKNIIFSEENLNKIEAIYGASFREALEDMLYRMENGTNRQQGNNRLVNQFQNWINNSVGTIMFFNARSAVLQTLSTVNFINWGDNNIAKAAMAFANQPQFWKDFAMLFNSDMLKQRRKGLKTDVNHAELVEVVSRSKNPVSAALNWLLQKGFLPTQIADSFAIASGGATFYRNRVNTYLKEGLSQKEAETKAFEDFQEIAEETQQSSRPDLISMQQASTLGRLILAFQNTPMQYMRLTKKSIMDLAAGRGDAKTHISRIIYYGAVQNVIFYSLQSALFALAFDDDEEEEPSIDIQKKKERILNGMLDSVLRGTGVYGAIVSTVKNVIIKLGQEEKKGWNKDISSPLVEALNLSPPIGSKARKFVSAMKTWNYNRDVIKQMDTFDIDNPAWEAFGNVVSFTTNVPLDRLINKTKNVREALNDQNEDWQRIALMLGWNRWDLNIKSDKVELVKTEIKEQKKIESKKKTEEKKIEKEKIREKENEKEIEKNIEKSKEDGICSAINKSGNRCGQKIVKGKHFCTVHEKVEINETGEKELCKGVRTNGKRCGMMTNNKSGYCYYHD